MTHRTSGDSPRSSKRRYVRRVAIALGVTLVASLLVVFFGVGRWLVVEDPLDKADAIVVLSGRIPMRAIEAARLYRQGYARKVWLTRPEQPSESLRSMNIYDAGEEYFNSRVLMHEGVPSGAICWLEPQINNTADEVRAVAEQLVRDDQRKVIFVTTKAHTRRVRTLWRKLSGGQGRAIIRATPEDPFDPAHWWRTSGDALDVLREVLGLVNAWAGFPLHPAPQ